MLRALTVLAILVALCAGPVSAEPGHPCSPDGIAVGGYDLVSYHQEAGPRLGLAGHSLQHNDLRYQFVDAANRAQFEAAPERYLPHYRGWCAASLSMGQPRCFAMRATMTPTLDASGSQTYISPKGTPLA